jgi:dienelactone hydrolase
MLFQPDGMGLFAAIVILHDCSGLGPRSSGAPARWAQELLGHDFVVLIPDSFTTRGHPGGVCMHSTSSRINVGPARRSRDAHAALAYLRTLPNVDGTRVGVMGGSHGGSSTLAAIAVSENDPDSGARATFAAAVALYPACGARYGGWRVERQYGARGPVVGYDGVYRPVAPLLILVGEADDWTPAEPCRELAVAAQREGYPVWMKSYPGAHHSFDSSRPVRYVAERVNVNSPTGQGATTGGNAAAWADSIRETVAFFGAHLAQPHR